MYQRYYKQRKFGKLFSLFLVIGSGIAHYLRSFYKNGKKILDSKYMSKYDSYLPEKFNNTLEIFNINSNSNSNISRSRSDNKLNKILIDQNIYSKVNEELLYDKNTNIYQFYSRPFLNEDKVRLNPRHKAFRIYLDFKDKII